MQIAVIGHGEASQEEQEAAYAAGRTIAGNGAVLVCGGLGGVMEAAVDRVDSITVEREIYGDLFFVRVEQPAVVGSH